MKDAVSKPLVIDVDDSLLSTDLLLESFWTALGRDAYGALKATYTHFKDRARVKHEMAELSELDVSRLPVNEAVLELAMQAKSEGREVVLASGSDHSLVEQLAKRFGLEGEHMASEGTTNLTGDNKRKALVERYGEGGFDYVGDALVDLSVWKSANMAYAVAPGSKLRKGLLKLGKTTQVIEGGWSPLDLVRALRPHQWVKNILLILPMIASHRADFISCMAVLTAMIAFSFAASSIYIVNDLLDLDADRQHEKKRFRPFASGKVPIRAGMITSIGLGIAALGVAALVNVFVVVLTAVYMMLSLAYSVYLKRLRWIDVWVLASLYVLRVIAGAAAVGVATSGWLIAFIFPVFMALGCVKRMTEVSRVSYEDLLPGRAYAKRDRPDLLNMSILSALNANIIFLAYTYSDTAYRLYAGIWELRWCVIPISVWMVRMISTGWRGNQHYDPIVFALRDRTSLVLAAVTVLGLLNAAAWVQ